MDVRTIWEDVLSDIDKQVIVKGGYGKRRGYGKHPIMMIIDPQWNYMGANKPIQEQWDEWPSGVGKAAWDGVGPIKKIVDKMHEKGYPVIITRNVQKKTLKFDSFSNKTNRDQTKYIDGNPATEIIPELAPAPQDIVIDKAYASVFYGTPIQSYLVKLGVDTIIMTGGSTSGCVRASTIDAIERSYNVAMVADCVFDRISISHKAGLLDCWMKYCDVVDSEDVLAYLDSLPANEN